VLITHHPAHYPADAGRYCVAHSDPATSKPWSPYWQCAAPHGIQADPRRSCPAEAAELATPHVFVIYPDGVPATAARWPCSIPPEQYGLLAYRLQLPSLTQLGHRGAAASCVAAAMTAGRPPTRAGDRPGCAAAAAPPCDAGGAAAAAAARVAAHLRTAAADFAYKKFLECSISLRECAIRAAQLCSSAAAGSSEE
jgi:hypothetical protein